MNQFPLNQTFDPKDPEEIIPLEFDFSQLGTGFSSPVVTVSHVGGVSDPDAADMVLGSATITSDVAVVAIQDGLHGADYLVRCTAVNGVTKYVISGILPVRNAVGVFSQSTILD